jgi:acylphosphatase
MPDGRVEICLEGEPGAVERVIQWCRQGPRWADVDDVEVIEEEPRGDRSFTIE